MTHGPTIDEIWPDRPPVCAGCGVEVDPQHAKLTTDFKLVCQLCAPRYDLAEDSRQSTPVG